MILKNFALLLTVVGLVFVLKSSDAAFCRQHEVLVPIAPNCEKTCNGGCSTHSKRNVIQRPMCICRPGFVRSGSSCVPYNSCKPPTRPPPCPTTCAPVTLAPTCLPVITTTPTPVTCPPVITAVASCPTTKPAPCPTSAVPSCVVTNPPLFEVTARPCATCGAATPCPCSPLVRFKFV